MSAFTNTDSYIRIALNTGISAALDYFMVYKNLYSNFIFGLSNAIATFASEYIASYIPAIIPDASGLYNGMTLQERILGVVGGSYGAVYLNKMFNNDYNGSPTMMPRMLISTIGSVGSVYLTDYIVAQPLAYLTNSSP